MESYVERIGFKNNIYYELMEGDQEAADLIDFLGLNHPTLYEQRSKHIKRLRESFQEAKYSIEEIQDFLKRNKEQLSFCTAIDAEFDINTDYLINS